MFVKSYTSCAVVLLMWFVTFSSGRDCIYDPDNQFYTHEGSSIGKGRQVVVPSLSFSCYGKLKHISYVTVNGSDPGGDLPVFQIWRPSSVGSSVYSRVAQTEFQDESLIQDTNRFYFTNGIVIFKDHQNDIQPGDVIGYYQPSNSQRLIWSINESGHTSYSKDASVPSTVFNTSNADVDVELMPYKSIEMGFDIRCDNLSVPSNGAITSCSSGSTGVGYEGDTCNFTCNRGYNLTGSDNRTCQSDGTWSGNETICSKREIQCDDLSVPSNGAIISCSSGSTGVGYEGDTCNFTCNTGYELIGIDNRTCQSDGTWSGNETRCSKRDVQCDNLSIPHGATISCSFDSTGVGFEGDTCNFTCNNGYNLTGNENRICQSDGTWSGSETMCSKVVCPLLTYPADGNISCFMEIDEVVTCNFTCNTGYELTGSDSRTCQSDGTWSGAKATCSKRACPPLDNPYNGKRNCSYGVVAHYEDICSFSCNTGYELTGNAKRICQNDGNWSKNEVNCTKVSCLELDRPKNGIVLCNSKEDNKYLYEDVCRFTCNTGYELFGSGTRSCRSDGSWSGTETVCEKGNSVTGGDGLASETKGSKSGSGSSGAAIGGVIGGVIAIIIIIIILLLIICYTRRVKKRKAHPPDGRILPNGTDLSGGVNNPLYGENTMTGLSGSDYEDPDLPDYSAMDATSKTKQYELPTSLVDKAATPSPPNTALRVKQNVYSTPYGDEGNYGSLYQEPSSDEQKIYEHFEGKMFRKLHHNEIRSFEELGVGEFGVVTRCMWKQSTDKELEVAVKTLNINASDKDRLRFLQEAAIMGQFDHPNVIQLYGIVTETPIMIVQEYMPHGNLRNFLMQMRHTNGAGMMPLTLLKYCNEVAAGMVYLSGKQFVHRDLAARNILMSEDFTCKIADFGMSRDLIDHNYYITSGGKVPVKWTAPEALHYRKYSVQSDVWSYGCVLYEIWSLGCKPFEELTNTEALQKVDRGYRLPPPPGCPRTIYRLIIGCWNPDPQLRPQFGQIAEVLAGDSECLLSWSVEDRQFGGENAMKLGAPLDNGNNLYTDLQMQYR